MVGIHWPVLGFDARERWCPPERLFPPARVATFLLRRDVEKVLSADVMVWPTVFVHPDVEHLELEDLGLGRKGIPRPDPIDGIQRLWSSVEAMEAILENRPRPLPGRPETLALTVRFHPLARLGPPLREGPGERWRLRGYDVVDSWLVSGLSNCGYLESEIGHLRGRWGPRLNRWHLFDSPEDAERFRRASDTRVPEHAPFLVCALLVRDPA